MELIEFFAGIGAFRQATENKNIDYKVIGISEYDKYAIKSYNAMHGKTENFGDINSIITVPKADMWTYGFPCQDISVAGNQEGIKEGTRSGLLLRFEEILERNIKIKEEPKFLLMENVKNLVGKKHKPSFDKWLNKLDELGYNSYWKVLNTKDYGLPQNRQRVFCFSVKKELDKGFEFPEKQELKLRLKDMLENEVDEKYYLSEKQCENLTLSDVTGTIITNKSECNKILEIGLINPRRHSSAMNSILDIQGMRPTIDTMQGGNRQPKVLIKNATKKGYQVANVWDGLSLEFPKSKTRRGRVQNQLSPTLQCSDSKAVITEKMRIRKLTPKECWRLQGFSDEQFEKAESVCSNSQLYKQSGNSISVNVLEAIYEKMIEFGYMEEV